MAPIFEALTSSVESLATNRDPKIRLCLFSVEKDSNSVAVLPVCSSYHPQGWLLSSLIHRWYSFFFSFFLYFSPTSTTIHRFARVFRGKIGSPDASSPSNRDFLLHRSVISDETGSPSVFAISSSSDSCNAASVFYRREIRKVHRQGGWPSTLDRYTVIIDTFSTLKFRGGGRREGTL